MQAQANILERIAQAYVARRGVRLLCVLGVLSAGTLLFWLSGGFPPYAWRLLAQTLPRVSALEAARGQAVLLALTGLVLLSLTLLLAWLTLLWLCWCMLSYWRYERQELRRFAEDAVEAQYLAEDDGAARATHYAREEAFAEDDSAAYAPRMNFRSVRQPRNAPLARYNRYPLALEEPGEDDLYPGELESEDGEEQIGVYQDEGEEALERFPDDAQVPAHRATASMSGVSVLPTQPVRPVHLRSVPEEPAVYDQKIIEHAGPGMPADKAYHSGYGRVVPFVPPANGRSHPPTGYYSRVPLAPAVPSTPAPATRRPTTRLIVSTGLDAGLKRKDRPNEDSLLALQNTRVLRGNACPVGLFVVADGMGGHTNGQEASRLVIQALSKTVVPSIIYGPSDDNYAELLAEGVHHANLEVYQRNRQQKANMGTTIAAALVVDTTAYVVSAGDSRVYLYRASSGLSQVTRDHSTVARLVENGLIPPEDIYTHPRRNEIYRSLGHHASEELDRFILALQPEDILLLCSDGLWEMVRDNQIEQIIASTLHQPTQISAALVQAALEGGGKDNISVIVVYIKAEEEARAAWAAG